MILGVGFQFRRILSLAGIARIFSGDISDAGPTLARSRPLNISDWPPSQEAGTVGSTVQSFGETEL